MEEGSKLPRPGFTPPGNKLLPQYLAPDRENKQWLDIMNILLTV